MFPGRINIATRHVATIPAFFGAGEDKVTFVKAMT